MTQLVAQHGMRVEPGAEPRSLSIGGPITSTEAPYDIVRKMRASILVLGPLLARVREARVSLPGGCSIGTRPVDLHLKGLEAMGASIELDGGYITARAPAGLHGATIVMPFASVGATENLLMAAALADGQTVLANAAREPEIGDLAACLIAMGAKITGVGTDRLTIEGVKSLHGATHRAIADRIETGTYACAAVITGGEVRLVGGTLAHLGAVASVLIEAGAEMSEQDGALTRPPARRAARRRRHDRALSRLPDRHAGPVHGGDGGRRRRGHGHRDHLREPVHARPRAEPHGRPHQRARLLGDHPRRRRPVRRAGDGDRSARLGLASCWPGWPRAARRW